MNKWLKRQFVKYCLSECRHICLLCKYKNECLDNFFEQPWKTLIEYYKNK